MSDTQEPYKLALQAELEQIGRGAQTRLAKFMRLRDDAVSRMKSVGGPEPRKISAHEWAQIVEFVNRERREAGLSVSEALRDLAPIADDLSDRARKVAEAYDTLKADGRGAVDAVLKALGVPDQPDER